MSEREECGYCGRTEWEGHAPTCPDHKNNRPTPSPDAATEPSTQAGDALIALSAEWAVRSNRKAHRIKAERGWVGETVSAVIAQAVADIETEARAASPKGEPASAQAVAPGLDERLRAAYTLLCSAEPALIRGVQQAPNATSHHYQSLLLDQVREWIAEWRAARDATTDPDAKEAGER